MQECKPKLTMQIGRKDSFHIQKVLHIESKYTFPMKDDKIQVYKHPRGAVL